MVFKLRSSFYRKFLQNYWMDSCTNEAHAPELQNILISPLLSTKILDRIQFRKQLKNATLFKEPGVLYAYVDWCPQILSKIRGAVYVTAIYVDIYLKLFYFLPFSFYKMRHELNIFMAACKPASHFPFVLRTIITHVYSDTLSEKHWIKCMCEKCVPGRAGWN